MARKRKVGMKTTDLVLLGGAGLLAVYLLTKPKTATTTWQTGPGGTLVPYNPVSQPVNPGNSTAGIITASGGALSDLLNVFL